MNRIRRSALVTVALAASLTLLATSCGDSDDDSSSDKTTTTEKQQDEETTTTEAAEGDTAAFGPALDQAEQGLEDASGDACALAEFLSSLDNLPDPADAQEVERAVDFVAAMLNALADTAPEANAAQADTLRQGATDLVAEGEAADFSVEWFNGQDTPKTLSDPELTAALGEFQTQTSTQCGSAPSTTVAG